MAEKPGKPNKPGKTGRPGKPRRDSREAKIDWDLFQRLCQIHCTVAEIGAVLGMCPKTLSRHVKKYQGCKLEEYLDRFRGVGRASLRRKQYALAMSGDKTMLIWLGKNELGQADKVEHTGKMSIAQEIINAAEKEQKRGGRASTRPDGEAGESTGDAADAASAETGTGEGNGRDSD